MPSAHTLHFPFTKHKEILDSEAFYLQGLSEMYQRLEPAVRVIKKNVAARQTSNTPGGYLCHSELREMARWKDHRLPSQIDENVLPLIMPGGVLTIWEYISTSTPEENLDTATAEIDAHEARIYKDGELMLTLTKSLQWG